MPNVRLWLGAEVRAPAWRLPPSGGKQTFVLDVRFFADFVGFAPGSGRIDTVTVESARDPKLTLALPQEVEHWSLTTLRNKLIKVVRHGRYITFQLAEVAIPRSLFANILRLIDGLRPAPLPP